MLSMLKEVYLDLFSDKECYGIYGQDFEPKLQLCSGDKTYGTGQCIGDFGGPLIWSKKIEPQTWYQIGIVSWIFQPCGNPKYPGLYTKVSNYINWINKKI